MTTKTESLAAMKNLSFVSSRIVRTTAPRRRKAGAQFVRVSIEEIEALHRALRHYPGDCQLEDMFGSRP